MKHIYLRYVKFDIEKLISLTKKHDRKRERKRKGEASRAAKKNGRLLQAVILRVRLLLRLRATF